MNDTGPLTYMRIEAHKTSIRAADAVIATEFGKLQPIESIAVVAKAAKAWSEVAQELLRLTEGK